MGDIAYEKQNPNKLLKILIYGYGKTRKTSWLTEAVKTGRHLYYIDGDQGSLEVIMRMPAELQSRIHVINCWDTWGGSNFQKFVSKFIQGKPFIWNDTKRQIEVNLGQGFNSEDAFWQINPRLVNADIIIGMDSWTRLIDSIVADYAEVNNIDLSSPHDLESDRWTYFRHAGMIADFAVKQFFAMPSNFVMIGHSTVYEKRKDDASGKQVVESSRTQLISVTGNHAVKLPTLFGHVLQFKIDSMGNNKIDVRPLLNADGGSRSIKPGIYGYADLSYAKICEMSYIPNIEDRGPSPAFIFYPPGELNNALATAKDKAKPASGIIEAVKKPTLASLGVKNA
jgi:hypothetical protein